MKEYGHLLRNDERWAARAASFADSVFDVLEFVAEQDFTPGLGPVDRTVALQEACHLAHAQGIREAPLTILNAIPGLRLNEMANPDRCCGSAGLRLAQPCSRQGEAQRCDVLVEEAAHGLRLTNDPSATQS